MLLKIIAFSIALLLCTAIYAEPAKQSKYGGIPVGTTKADDSGWELMGQVTPEQQVAIDRTNARLKAKKMTSSLGGIELGMKPVEVTLQLGVPDKNEGVKEYLEPGVFRQILYYENVDDDESSINFLFVFLKGREADLRVYQICGKGSHINVASFMVSSNESEITEILGEPSGVSINTDGTRKFITYNKLNAAYQIEKGKVVTICLTSDEKVVFKDEYIPDPKGGVPLNKPD